ncbi:MAG: cell division protein FtsK [Candidatus Vogelbacteria bacterium CG10_big_fil_rev_8_21_14_0_10_50_13]|uniref:Cell division protein FtsK n=1 Tax=Candidatus Vogelbacteria bacterium CG10_big_fil_rev_8_21_14_0_10_50_13 TaxID=1975044 RepID=A0A2H0RGB9_9BACT|nr:MAG: cell division protein FtsK [Candidatus Vogelbacteria bacterium CG10_big_fil_rev_8_21_14_0_10_50_13]
MAKKKVGRPRKKRPVDELDDERPSAFLRGEIKDTIWAIALSIIGIFLLLSSLGKAGPAGRIIYNLLHNLFGQGFFLIPLLLFLVAVSFVRDSRPSFAKFRIGSGMVAFASLLALLGIFYPESGGWLGNLIASPLLKLFDIYVSVIITLALAIIAGLVLFDSKITLDGRLFGLRLWGEKEDELFDDEGNELEEDELTEDNFAIEDPADLEGAPEPEPIAAESKNRDKLGAVGVFSGFIARGGREAVPFAPPPLALLSRDSGRPGVGDIKANANIIKRTLANFGITVEMDEISIGPSITRYAFKPAEGVRLSRILTLQRDLELSLAAHPIRIEAPIPGKALVGIEIPNTTKTTVGLGSLIGNKAFADNPDPLLVSLGRGISGEPYFARLTKAPHLLVAGATGAGKSVTIHTMITSLLYRQPPENLRFIMIDPKRVELTLYNRIPHLLTPVITDPKKAILALRWAAGEMDRRYNILEAEAVRDIASYHKNVLEPALTKFTPTKVEGPNEETGPERMPYIVIIIDELADIMSTYPRELEAAIVRLAQMSRAVGIHLIISTQRPSVEVITGLIKANIPSRVALQVTSQIDSRTILDTPGAEKLLGAGDMLYQGAEMGKPIRLQSAFITEDEVKKVTSHLAKSYEDVLPDTISFEPEAGHGGRESLFGTALDAGDDDDLYEDARVAVAAAGKASASYLQRKLKVGYARAARLIDMLEERGVVGPGEGAKPREVYNNQEGYGREDEE